jgi:hypothetical protein
MLSYNISVKVRQVTRVDGPPPPPPPPPPPFDGYGDRDRSHPCREDRHLPCEDREFHGRSDNYGRSGRSGPHANGGAPPDRVHGRQRHLEVIDVSSSSSLSSPTSPSPPSSTASTAPAYAARRRRRDRRGRNPDAGTTTTAPTSPPPDKPLQRWVVKGTLLTAPATLACKEAAPISNEATPLGHVDDTILARTVPLQSNDKAAPPPPSNALPMVHDTIASPLQFMVGSFLLSAPEGPTMEATADLLPCPLWDTSPETLTGHSPILDLVMSTPDPLTPPPPPPPVADSLQQQSPAQPIERNPPTPTPTNTRRHLDFEGSSWAVYSRRPKAVSLPDPPSPRPRTRAATLKALASPATPCSSETTKEIYS